MFEKNNATTKNINKLNQKNRLGSHWPPRHG